MPDSDEEQPAGKLPKVASHGKAHSSNARAGEPNPVVWMDLAVAGKARGRVHFELFKDVCPLAVENFRRLCVGMDVSGALVSYKDMEFDSVIPGKFLEGGDLKESLDLPPVEQQCSLRHAKAGLLSMEHGSPSFGSSRFQLTLGATPELDGRQIVFGQLLGSPKGLGPELHALHWAEAVGSSSGIPREAVVVEACGESGAGEAEVLLGAMVMAAQVDRTSESQEDRYGRAGISHGQLVDAVTDENVPRVLELTDDLLEHLQYAAKKARTASEKDRKAQEIETSLKSLLAVLQHVEFKAGEVSGFDNKVGRNAKAQLSRAKDLEQSLVRLY